MTGDQERMVDLLRRLDEGPPRAARVDLAGAMHEGRRRRRARRARSASAAGLAVLAAVSVPLTFGGDSGSRSGRAPQPAAPSVSREVSPSASPPAGPTSCAAERLPVPGGYAKSVVTGGDPSGRYLLGRSYPGDGRGNPVIVWYGGRAFEYRLPGSDQRLVDVNPTGLAVGSTYVNDRPRPYFLRGQKTARLPGVEAGEAMAVSADGRVVGARLDGERRRPVLWASVDTPARDLPLPGSGWEGTAVGVDADGTVVGKIQNGPSGSTRTVVWRAGGEPELLPVPSVDGGTASEFVADTLQNGWITGAAFRDVGEVRKVYPVRYHLPSGRYEPLPQGVVPTAGNGRGWVIGYVGRLDTGLLTESALVRLPDLDGRTGRYRTVAVSVSDDAAVVGGQLDVEPGATGLVMQAVRWRCH
ncbi:hypothetical protein ABZ814_25540 [Micromonospora musae]|uniref:hypothetical protein n=1 Tax=Micromonospora musae TaxID=1894970 RepID=UPI0034056F0A